MKKILSLLLTFVLAAVVTTIAFAQSASTTDSLNPANGQTSWQEWNLYGVNVILILRFLGEAFNYLKTGGGIIGMAKTLLYGTNIPAPIAKDYKEELQPKPKDEDLTENPRGSG